METSGMAAWHSDMKYTDDEEDHDSDTDSKLSGSAIVDSVMKKFRTRGFKDYPPVMSGDFSFDPVADQRYVENQAPYNGNPDPRLRLGAGYPLSSSSPRTSPNVQRRPLITGSSSTSPKSAVRANGGLMVSHAQHRHKKDVLSPVPETSASGARVLEVSTPYSNHYNGGGGGHFGLGTGAGSALHYSAESVNKMSHYHHNNHHQPADRIADCNGDSGAVERDANGHILVRGSSFSNGTTSSHPHPPPPTSLLSNPLRGSMGSIASQGKGGRPSAGAAPRGEGHAHGAHGRPPQHGGKQQQGSDLPRDVSYHSTISGAGRFDPNEPFERSVSVARSDISQLKDTKEPNLDDVVDYLASSDPNLVIKAASYLQHLSYGDDSMKAKIRTFGAIPVLVSQLRNAENKVHIAVLGTLKNVSYGRANDQNKMVIVEEKGLAELMILLKTTRIPEVRDLTTAVVWNMATCEALKQQILDSCLQDLMASVIVPSVGWSPSGVNMPDAIPTSIQWCVELRNATGILRSLSGGEQASTQMRRYEGLVDCLVWVVKAGGQLGQQCDDKTVENAICVLRNLTYHLDQVPEFRDGPTDTLDDDDDLDGDAHKDRVPRHHGSTKHHTSSSILPGCLLLCARPLTDDYAGISMPARVAVSDSESQGPVVGMHLLWHPSTVRSYITLIEKYSACPDTLEGTAGAIQNLTAYSCKWSARTRALVCESKGLQLLVELINSTHDMAVRTASLALRNLCSNSTNKIAVGAQAIVNIVPRLPFGHNHLGISEHTTVALLCCLTKLCFKCPENAKLLGDIGGISLVLRLTRSRQHTQKLVFASSKLCAVLYGHKECKTLLKREGWDLGQYTRMCKENTIELEYDTTEIGSQVNVSRKSKKEKKSKSMPRHQEQQPLPGTANTPSEDSHHQPDHKPPALTSTSTSEDTLEPGYSTVNVVMATSPPPSSQPVGMYQSINDPQLKATVDKIKQDNVEHSSGPMSQLSSSELSDQGAAAATYAHVDIDKKKASRRRKEGEEAGKREGEESENNAQQQQGEKVESSSEPDSWV